MYFVNVVKMKIPITIFICISISSARSTESNSSLLESKVDGGVRADNTFQVNYAGFIITALKKDIKASTTFINVRNCLVSKRWAEKIDEKINRYLVESPNIFGKQSYCIDSVYITRDDYFVAAQWGVVKLKIDVDDQTDFVSFVNPRSPEFHMRYYTFAGGWSYNDDCDAYLAYLKIELLSVVLCRDEIIKHYGRYLHNLACGVATGGCFYNIEEGAGLFVDNNKLLGVAVKPALELGDISIFALVYNDETFIHRFVNKAPKPSKSKSKKRLEGTYSASTIQEHTSSSANLNPMYPGQMYPHHQSQMGGYGSSYMDTQHHGSMGGYGSSYMDIQHHGSMGGYGSSYMDTQHHGSMGGYGTAHMDPHSGGSVSGYNQGQMGGYGQNFMGTRDQGDIDSCYPSFTSSQLTGDLDDSEVHEPSLRPITTGRRRSGSTRQNAGPQSVAPLDRMIRNLNIGEENERVPVPESVRLIGVRPSANPRRQNSDIQEDARVPGSVRVTGTKQFRNLFRRNTRS